MLADINFYNDCEMATESMQDAINTFKENIPYTSIRGLDGNTYLFTSHFTECVVLFFSTQCMSSMSRIEQDFLLLFIDWQNFLLTDPQNPITAGSVEDTYESDEKDALLAFNNWLVDEIAGTPHPETC